MTGRYLISGSLVSRWRRERDSNPRWDFVPYTLSRGAPSTTRPSLLKKLSPQMFCDLLNNERGGLLRAILPFALRAAVALLRRSAAVLSSAILRAGNSGVLHPWAHPLDGPTIHRIVGLTAAPRRRASNLDGFLSHTPLAGTLSRGAPSTNSAISPGRKPACKNTCWSNSRKAKKPLTC